MILLAFAPFIYPAIPPIVDLGNSPLEFTRGRVGGRTIVMTTSNGTRALVAARPAAAVGVAAFINHAAAAAWALARGRDVLLLCAGERGARSLYRTDFATFEADSVYRQRDAEGFINLNALRLKIRSLRDRRP